MTLTTAAMIYVGIASVAINAYVMYPGARAEHKYRQAARLEYGGWTTPWWASGLWWIGAENAWPKAWRKS